MQRKIRVLVGKPGLDGHDRGAKVVAAALRDAGMEVIYTGLHQTPEQIVEAAVQEDVDVVALSILSGAHMTLFPEVLEMMRARGLGDRLLSGGGIVPPEDVETLARMGVGKLFGPGSSTRDIAAYIRSWFVERHGDILAPSPKPAEPRPFVSGAAAKPAVSTTVATPATKAAKPEAKRAAKPAKKRVAKKRASKERAVRKPAPKARRKAASRRAPKRTAKGGALKRRVVKKRARSAPRRRGR